MSFSPRIITFSKFNDARTGNILFQYLFCIRISLLYGHKYVALEDLEMHSLTKTTSLFKITDKNISEIIDPHIHSSHILCEGFFQNDELYLPVRDQLLAYLHKTDDSWIGSSGKREYIQDFLSSQHPVQLFANDIVMSLRLDDFIQLPNPTSDILPPHYYMDILEKWFSYYSEENWDRSKGRLIIVSDKFHHYWEHKYVEYFSKWSPVFVQNTLLEDFALMRDCPALIHSNSTLCWFASFLSSTKTHRFIPVTGTYPSQHLESIIPETDTVFKVLPLEHREVYGINIMCWHRDIQPLPYCIPDEMFSIGECEQNSRKKYVISPLIPGDTSNYMFRAGEEAKYYNMYGNSMFALTKKKGGWDCLRHYEILASGCIPIFEDIQLCPQDTLVSFPKSILREAYNTLLPWRDTKEQQEAYLIYASRLLDFAKSNCSTSSNAMRFFRDMSRGGESFPNILMLVGHPGVNYTRELNWIGIKRLIGSTAVEYPPLDFLYDDFPESRLHELYGNGFTYSRRISSQLRSKMNESELIESIRQKKWDMIIYGKVGPDETAVGSVPNLPFWGEVFKRYSRDEIVFWYGGDELQDMTYANRYSEHLVTHCQYARCFVRELIKWDGTFK